MKPLYILKIGGSVVTYKNRQGVYIRKTLLKNIAKSIIAAQKHKDFELVIIHGAGSAGHQLAHQYGLKDGARNDKKKWYGSLISRLANTKLDLSITEILINEGLPATSVHTASAIIQENKKIKHLDIDIVEEALRHNCVPILYGEMVFDQTLGMTICSGDAIAPYLAEKLKAEKLFFASDIDGVFSKDPHLHKDARLIENVSIGEIEDQASLSGSHNVDVTGGLWGKIKSFEHLKGKIKTIEIFNGLKQENFKMALSGEKFSHTTIKMR